MSHSADEDPVSLERTPWPISAVVQECACFETEQMSLGLRFLAEISVGRKNPLAMTVSHNVSGSV